MSHVKDQPYRGSYLPVLMRLMQLTNGPVLELGCGNYSTPYLHWACYATKRRLVTYEHNPQYYPYLQQFANDYHHVHCITDWDAIDLSEPWSIAFVDHGRPEGRHMEAAKVQHAEYVLCHDTENRFDRHYHFSKIYHLFKYHYRYDVTWPHTTILSNTHDLSTFTVVSPTLGVDIPLVVVSAQNMEDIHSSPRRRYTICRAASDVYRATSDPYIKSTMRYISTLANCMVRKIEACDPGWLKKVYPRQQDVPRIMGD